MSIGREPSDVVVVTGVGGMGIAIARRLGSGRRVVLGDSSAPALEAAATVLRDEGHWVHDLQLDVSDRASVQAFALAAAALGPVRAVVHTAGVSPVQASAERIVAVDVIGTALLLDEFLEVAGDGTVMVCIASMAGVMMPLPGDVEHALAITPTAELAGLSALDPKAMEPAHAYVVAKRANQLRVQAASVAWGAKGGRVVSISPGVISTPMGRAELDGPSGEQMRAMIEMSGVKRAGTPDDIAAVVEFLVSPAAGFISGTDLLVDGGVVAAIRYGLPT